MGWVGGADRLFELALGLPDFPGPICFRLYYMLKWESLDDRAKRFAGFQADPAWVSGRAETEKNGQIVASITNTILQPTSFSSVK